MNIRAIHANLDNWVYVHPYQAGRCWVVDPSDAAAVTRTIEETGLMPTHILTTHHHSDHTAGISALKKAYGCAVLSADARRIPDTDVPVHDGFSLTLGEWTITVMATPGHTATGVCYFCTHPTEAAALYSGDTLFACGCGRLFECSAETLYASLQRLAALPERTGVFCGHDYTEDNVRFALTLEPDHNDLKQLLGSVRTEKGFTPTTLGQEKRCNPFLRTGQPSIRRAVGLDDPVAVFAELRRRKDRF